MIGITNSEVESCDLCEVSGEELAVEAKEGIPALAIHGKTYQDGAPFPENPVEIHGVGESLNLLKIPNQTTIVKGASITVTAGVITSVGAPSEFITVELCAFTLEAGTYYFKRNTPNAVVDVVLVAPGITDVVGDQVITLTEKRTYALYYVCSTTAGGVNVSTPIISIGKVARPWQPYGHKVAVKRTCGTSQLEVIYPLSSPLYEGDKIQTDGKIIRKKKKIILLGTETLYVYGGGKFSIDGVVDDIKMASPKLICSHFKVVDNAINSSTKGVISLLPGFPVLGFNTELETETEIRKWFSSQADAGIPVTIVYELAVSVVEQVNPSAQLELMDGINTIRDTSSYPATLHLYYSKSGMPVFNCKNDPKISHVNTPLFINSNWNCIDIDTGPGITQDSATGDTTYLTLKLADKSPYKLNPSGELDFKMDAGQPFDLDANGYLNIRTGGAIGINDSADLVVNVGEGLTIKSDSETRIVVEKATSKTFGGVKAVTVTNDMTQPVGINNEGLLFTGSPNTDGCVFWSMPYKEATPNELDTIVGTIFFTHPVGTTYSLNVNLTDPWHGLEIGYYFIQGTVMSASGGCQFAIGGKPNGPTIVKSCWMSRGTWGNFQ